MTLAEQYGPWALIAGASVGLGAAIADAYPVDSAQGEVTAQELPPTKLAFDENSEDPQENHVAEQVGEAGVGENVGDPLGGVQVVAVREHPFVVGNYAGLHAEENQHIGDDHADGRKRPIENGRVGGVGEEEKHGGRNCALLIDLALL